MHRCKYSCACMCIYIYHTISYISYHIISYYIIFYYIIYIISYHITSYFIISYYIILYHIILYYIVLYYNISYYIILYCIKLYLYMFMYINRITHTNIFVNMHVHDITMHDMTWNYILIAYIAYRDLSGFTNATTVARNGDSPGSSNWLIQNFSFGLETNLANSWSRSAWRPETRQN